MITKSELRARYNATPEGKLLQEMGREYFDTESSARRVAEFASAKLDKLEKENAALHKRIADALSDDVVERAAWAFTGCTGGVKAGVRLSISVALGEEVKS